MELIHGHPHAKAPSPVGAHQYVMGRIIYNLNKKLELQTPYGDIEFETNEIFKGL